MRFVLDSEKLSTNSFPVKDKGNKVAHGMVIVLGVPVCIVYLRFIYTNTWASTLFVSTGRRIPTSLRAGRAKKENPAFSIFICQELRKIR